MTAHKESGTALGSLSRRERFHSFTGRERMSEATGLDADRSLRCGRFEGLEEM